MDTPPKTELLPPVYGEEAPALPAQKPTLLTPMMVEFGAAASSMLMGAVTAWRLVMERSFSNFSSLQLTTDLKAWRDAEGQHLQTLVPRYTVNWNEGASKYTICKTDPHTPTLPDYLHTRIKSASDTYQELLHRRFQESEYEGFAARLKMLHPHQKWEVAITSLAVTGVALGSILLLTKDIFSSMKDEASAAPPDDSKDTTKQEGVSHAERYLRENTAEASPHR